MYLYVVPWVQFQGRGSIGNKPLGADQLTSWSVLQLDDAFGTCLLGSPDPMDVVPKGVTQLASDKSERLSAPLVRSLSNKLGENLDTTRYADVPTLLLDLNTTLADGVKRKTLVPSLRSGVKQLEVWLGGELVATQRIPSGGAVEVTDNFNRSNSTTLGGSWVEDNGDWSIDSNLLKRAGTFYTDDYARWGVDLSTANHYAQVVAVEVNGIDGNNVHVRKGSSGGYGYSAGQDDVNLALDIHNATNWVADLATTSGAVATNDLLRLEANGSSLQYFINGVLTLSVTDSTYTTNRQVGVYAWGNEKTFDNFEAGSLGGATDHPQTLSVTSVGGTTIIRRTSKIIVVTSTGVEVITRCTAKPLVSASSASASSTRSTGKRLSAVCGSATTALRGVGKLVVASSAGSSSLSAVSLFRRALTVTCASSSSFVRRIGKPLSGSSAGIASMTASTVKILFVTLSVTSTAVSTCAKNIGKRLSAGARRAAAVFVFDD